MKRSRTSKRQNKIVKKPKTFNEKDYPWVVPGSVKEYKPGTKVDGITVAHGKICQIKCQETGKLRTINVQDAFQVKFCVESQARKAGERARSRRKAKKAKKKSR